MIKILVSWNNNADQKILRMGAQKTLIQKTYEINVGQDSIDIDFLGANTQFDWIELSLVYSLHRATLHIDHT